MPPISLVAARYITGEVADFDFDSLCNVLQQLPAQAKQAIKARKHLRVKLAFRTTFSASDLDSLASWLIDCTSGALPPTYGKYRIVGPPFSFDTFDAIEECLNFLITGSEGAEWVCIWQTYVVAQTKALTDRLDRLEAAADAAW